MVPDDSSYTNVRDENSKDFRLIEMVKTYPELYDSNADNHGDVNHTDILWEIIGKTLKYDGNTFEFNVNNVSLVIQLFFSQRCERKVQKLTREI